jgi:hypothetical protein
MQIFAVATSRKVARIAFVFILIVFYLSPPYAG